MSFKLVKDPSGKVVAFGPGPQPGAPIETRNDEGVLIALTPTWVDHYEPTVPPGHTLEIVEEYTPEVDPKAALLSAIQKLEDANPFTHRKLRDLSLALAAGLAAITGKPATGNPSVVQMMAIDAEITALRKKL